MSDTPGLPDEPTGDEFTDDAAFPEQDEPETTERRTVTAVSALKACSIHLSQ